MAKSKQTIKRTSKKIINRRDFVTTFFIYMFGTFTLYQRKTG